MLYKIIAYLEKNGKTYESERSNFEITDDKGIKTITLWNVTDLEKPTNTQLDELEEQANKIKINWESPKPNKTNLKLSAKTKLMNGEALTEDEANVMVGL